MKKTKLLRRMSKWANSGDPYAQYVLGVAMMEGTGTQQNENMGLFYLSLSASQDYKDAQDYLAQYYFDDNASTQAES